MNAYLGEEHDGESGPDLVDESVELVPGRLAAWVKVEDELWVERGGWIDGRREDVVREGCDEGGERSELFRGGEGERRAWWCHRVKLMGHLAEWPGGWRNGRVVLVRTVVVLHVSEE